MKKCATASQPLPTRTSARDQDDGINSSPCHGGTQIIEILCHDSAGGHMRAGSKENKGEPPDLVFEPFLYTMSLIVKMLEIRASTKESMQLTGASCAGLSGDRVVLMSLAFHINCLVRHAI